MFSIFAYSRTQNYICGELYYCCFHNIIWRTPQYKINAEKFIFRRHFKKLPMLSLKTLPTARIANFTNLRPGVRYKARVPEYLPLTVCIHLCQMPRIFRRALHHHPGYSYHFCKTSSARIPDMPQTCHSGTSSRASRPRFWSAMKFLKFAKSMRIQEVIAP